MNKCSLEQLFLRRASLETMTTTLRHKERLSLDAPRSCSGDSSSDYEEEEGLLDNLEFVRNRKERSTVLVRRFYKNNQKVHAPKITLFLFLCVLSVNTRDSHAPFLLPPVRQDDQISLHWNQSNRQNPAIGTHLRGSLGGGFLLHDAAAQQEKYVADFNLQRGRRPGSVQRDAALCRGQVAKGKGAEMQFNFACLMFSGQRFVYEYVTQQSRFSEGFLNRRLRQ